MDEVVVDCHHSLCVCGDRMKMSLPKKITLERLPLLPGSHFGRESGPKGDYSALVVP